MNRSWEYNPLSYPGKEGSETEPQMLGLMAAQSSVKPIAGEHSPTRGLGEGEEERSWEPECGGVEREDRDPSLSHLCPLQPLRRSVSPWLSAAGSVCVPLSRHSGKPRCHFRFSYCKWPLTIMQVIATTILGRLASPDRQKEEDRGAVPSR